MVSTSSSTAPVRFSRTELLLHIDSYPNFSRCWADSHFPARNLTRDCYATVNIHFKFKFKRQIWSWTGIWISDLQISSMVLYYLSYPHSIDGTGLNLPLESNAIQALWSVTIWPTNELRIIYLLWYFKIKLHHSKGQFIVHNLQSRSHILELTRGVPLPRSSPPGKMYHYS